MIGLGLSRPHLHYPDRPLHHFLRDSAERYPERVALRSGSDVLSYRDLDALANAMARALSTFGLQRGDRLALIAPNSADWVVTLFGASVAGVSVALLNPRWRRGEVAHALELTAPRAVVADLASAEVIDDLGTSGVKIATGPRRDGWEALGDLVRNASGSRPAAAHNDWNTLEVALPFSSGTTGLPKAVRHTHHSLVASTIQWKAAGGISDDDRLLLFLPLFHVYGTITLGAALAAGATLTLLPRFDPAETLQVLERERITITFGAAPIAQALAEYPALETFDVSNLRYFVWGATPLNSDVAQRVSDRSGIRWLHAYGASEAPLLHCNPVHHPDQWRLDTPGLPVSDLEVRVVGIEDRVDVPVGQEGEILVRGPQVMRGYLPEDATADAFEDGWLRTGDIGWVEPEGWLHLVDRAKDMLKVNAFQVAPAELERVLLEHPAVADCAVFGIPDPRTGEAPKAAVVLRQGATAGNDELLEWVAGRVATYKRLREIDFVEEIPRNASGKALRRLLRSGEPSTT